MLRWLYTLNYSAAAVIELIILYGCDGDCTHYSVRLLKWLYTIQYTDATEIVRINVYSC
jgi:hypothetical protein